MFTYCRKSFTAFCCVAAPGRFPPTEPLEGAPAYRAAHSRATRWNSSGWRSSILATSASCGSLGSGVLSSDCRDNNADRTVKTGDQALESVSRQMAPWRYTVSEDSLANTAVGYAYCLAANVGMPHFRFKFHAGGTKGVVGRDGDLDIEGTTFIGSPRRTRKGSTQIRDIIMISDRFDFDLGMGIGLDVGKFFAHASHAISRHS